MKSPICHVKVPEYLVILPVSLVSGDIAIADRTQSVFRAHQVCGMVTCSSQKTWDSRLQLSKWRQTNPLLFESDHNWP